MKPVAIHRYGLITALGNNAREAAQSLYADRTAFSQYEGFPVAAIADPNAVDKDRLRHPHKGFKRLDRSTRLALLAADQLRDGLFPGKRAAVAIGSSRGATGIWEEAHAHYLERGKAGVLDSPLTTSGNLGSHVGHYLDRQNIVDLDQSITCASGLRAIADGCAWLQSGWVDQAIAGGSEAPLTPFTLAQMDALGLMTPSVETLPCRAMDPGLQTNTMVLGEGAVLFHLSGNLSPQATGYIVGVGFGSEPVTSPTGISPEGECLQRSMRMALKMAGWKRPDALVAHAPGTVVGDSTEREAIRNVFGSIPTTTTKFMTGHCFGASGPLGLWMALEMMAAGKWISPPWISENSPERLDKIIINAVGFGANAVSLAIAKRID